MISMWLSTEWVKTEMAYIDGIARKAEDPDGYDPYCVRCNAVMEYKIAIDRFKCPKCQATWWPFNVVWKLKNGPQGATGVSVTPGPPVGISVASKPATVCKPDKEIDWFAINKKFST